MMEISLPEITQNTYQELLERAGEVKKEIEEEWKQGTRSVPIEKFWSWYTNFCEPQLKKYRNKDSNLDSVMSEFESLFEAYKKGDDQVITNYFNQ